MSTDFLPKRRRRMNLIEAAMKYRQITLTITAILMLAGVWALVQMPRMEDPAITIRQGLVIVAYPGASEVDVEQQVTMPLEQYLFGFEEVRKEKTYSTSKQGQVVVTVQLQDWVKNKDQFWATLQHGLNGFGAQRLPRGVIGPFVNADFGETVALMMTLSSPKRSYKELNQYMDTLEDAIKTLPLASKIRRFGTQKEQILVSLNNESLRQYGIDAYVISQALGQTNAIQFAGEVKNVAGADLPLVANSLYQSQDDLGKQIVYTTPAGESIRLEQVATLSRGYAEEKSFIKYQGNRALLLSVEMQPGNNILEFGNQLDERLTQVKAQLPPDLQIASVTSQPHVVRHKLQEFFMEFAIALGAVILVVVVLLPFRMAVISAIASPISILVTFAMLSLLGYEIHQVTLAALIICLGMVVDDAIVVVDNYVEQLDHGLPRWEAAWQSATQLFVPIFTATATIIFSFLPLMFTMHGLAAEFVSQLPPTVIIALASSFLVAIFLTPLLCYLFIGKGLAHQANGNGNTLMARVDSAFEKLINTAFRFPRLTLSISVLSVAGAGFIGSKLPSEFLPIAERDQFNIELHMREGTSLAETEKAVDKLVSTLANEPRVKDVVSFVGTSSPRFYASYAPEAPRENFAQIFINTVSATATEELVRENLDKLEESIPNGQVRLRQLSFQEALAPIEIRLQGERLEDLKHAASQVTQVLEENAYTNFVRNDYGQDYLGMQVTYNDDELARLGLTRTAVAQSLGAGLSGFPVSTFWDGKEPVEIAMRLDHDDRDSLNKLGNLYLTGQNRNKVQLQQVAQLQPGWHTGQIVRRNGLRTLTVRSEAQKGKVAADVMKQLKPALEALKLPAGVTMTYGGDAESTLENMPDLGKALGISALLIFITLLLQFREPVKALIILCSFPLSLFGAMLGLYISGNHAGFTTFLGLTSLIGIVVRNGIILVDFADERVRAGDSLKVAAMTSAKRRMRPIFLTTAAAAVGVVPMIVGGSPLWSPMGSILACGLLFSMFMTLFTIPLLYWRWVRPERPLVTQVADGRELALA